MYSKHPISNGSEASTYATFSFNGDLLMPPQEGSSLPYIGVPIAAADPMEPELEEKPASYDGFLEYINSMLMDETFEDSSWQLLAHNAGELSDPQNRTGDVAGEKPSSSASLSSRYEDIFRGFHDILDGVTSNSASFDSIEATSGVRDELISEGFNCPRDVHGRGFSHGDDLHRLEEDVNTCGFGYDSVTGEALKLGWSKAYAHGDSVQSCQLNGEDQQRTDGIGNDGDGPVTREADACMDDSPSFASSLSVKKAEGQDQDISLVENADLPAELYAQLFDEWPHKRKGLPWVKTARGNLRSEGRRDEALENLVDLKGLLLESAKAVGEGNVKRAMETLQQIQQEGASPHGSGLQRVVHYFSEALRVRLTGMGNAFYKAIANTTQLPSPLMMLKAYKMVFEACPYVKIAYHFANQSILKLASGVSRLHIVDYGIFYGFQWPCLIYTLAHRHGGPPFLRITGIEFPANPSDRNPTATTEGTSRRLREYANTYNVPFEYHAISVSRWEDIDASSLSISEDEVLVLNSFNRLGHIHDESITHPSPRDRLLKQMRRLNPRLLVMGSMNAAHSSPFFAPRFREAFFYYSNLFDVLHTTMMNESPERAMFERELMGRAILNVVACEGVERVELPETYKQWQVRMSRVGFHQLPIIPSVWQAGRAIMKFYHKDFNLLHDSNKWVLLGWRGRTMQALSAWEPE